MKNLWISCLQQLIVLNIFLVGTMVDGFIRTPSRYSSLLSSRFLSSSSEASSTNSLKFICDYQEIIVPTLKGIHLTDITPQIRAIVKEKNFHSGQINVISKHTTTSVIINELESRLVDDTRQYLLKLAPDNYPYLHNDLHLRSGPPGKFSVTTKIF